MQLAVKFWLINQRNQNQNSEFFLIGLNNGLNDQNVFTCWSSSSSGSDLTFEALNVPSFWLEMISVSAFLQYSQICEKINISFIQIHVNSSQSGFLVCSLKHLFLNTIKGNLNLRHFMLICFEKRRNFEFAAKSSFYLSFFRH